MDAPNPKIDLLRAAMRAGDWRKAIGILCTAQGQPLQGCRLWQMVPRGLRYSERERLLGAWSPQGVVQLPQESHSDYSADGDR